MTSDTSNREITNSRGFSYPREQVFGAFADAARLARWWGPKGFSNTFHAFDFRPGGLWNFTMHSAEGHDFKNECVFQEIREPERIVIDHVSTPRYLLEVTLEPVDGGSGTRLLWVQRFETAEMRDKIVKFAGPANEELLDRLEAVLGEG